MAWTRKLLLVCVSAFALHGLQACAGETELNPQPLPPQGGAEQTPPPNPDKNSGNDTTGAGGSSGTSGTPAAAVDGGADGATDSGDAGAD